MTLFLLDSKDLPDSCRKPLCCRFSGSISGMGEKKPQILKFLGLLICENLSKRANITAAVTRSPFWRSLWRNGTTWRLLDTFY